MANPLRPTGNCFSIGLIDGTLRLHASGPSLILPGLESCSLLNESIILDSTFQRERICLERSAQASYRPHARRPQDRVHETHPRFGLWCPVLPRCESDRPRATVAARAR